MVTLLWLVKELEEAVIPTPVSLPQQQRSSLWGYKAATIFINFIYLPMESLGLIKPIEISSSGDAQRVATGGGKWQQQQDSVIV